MQTLALENYGVVEMETTEKKEIDGGWVFLYTFTKYSWTFGGGSGSPKDVVYS